MSHPDVIKHSFVGFVDRFGGGIPEPVCACEGPWNLYDGWCLVQERERRQAVAEEIAAAIEAYPGARGPAIDDPRDPRRPGLDTARRIARDLGKAATT